MENQLYKIKLSNAAFKDLKGLDKKIINNLLVEINLLSESALDLRKDIKKLKGLGKNIFRLRVGEFRVIYILSGLEIVILRIIDRKNLIRIINSMKFG
ncbi:MAG: type II toxin-antitoxin system RelE/ParE family toxin [Actinobacteria bacterium]|nr:type II toxin-antitoxin system RelE/ParE family toxin [Actinomycetota bacterium]